MALLGQASGGFTESSSALRILHVGVRNTVGQLSSSAFTQTNPPTNVAASTEASGLLDGVVRGVLSGSIAFADNTGDNTHGGVANAVAVLGVFINNAVGNAFENQPGVASNRGPYVSAQGTYANLLYETVNINTGADIIGTYVPGASLFASANGFLTTANATAAHMHGTFADLIAGNLVLADATNGIGAMAILKIAPDSTSDELVYDQRI